MTDQFYKKIIISNNPYRRNMRLETILRPYGIEQLVLQTAYHIWAKKPDAFEFINEIFLDGITQTLCEKIEGFNYLVEITYKNGVTDNPANSAREAFSFFDQIVDIKSIQQYLIKTQQELDILQNIANENLYNELIQDIAIYKIPEDGKIEFIRPDYSSQKSAPNEGFYQSISLPDEEEELLKLCDEMLLALNIEELRTIKNYYQKESTKKKRQAKGLPIDPTDLELEVYAQTWSEHCKHKIFGADIQYTEDSQTRKKLGPTKIQSLYREYIKQTTRELDTTWCLSVFEDNAGIVDFDANINLCVKVETHNSPSALDPYGGALTGILGVNRDIMGTGIGAKPIANTDVFCLADPEWPNADNKSLMPVGPKSPAQMLPGVHKGVEDGGNKSGIPTVNGAMYFDRDFAGKPLIFVGTVGAMPKKLNSEQLTHKKYGRPGDYIVMAGGAIGKDGIHGATFSSLDLDEKSPTSAVQIGDPFTQKRLLDFTIAARDNELFSSVTDNGAGGLSSSVGEMAETIGGGRLYLDLCPLKYPGLTAAEIMISESQERMTYAVPPQKWQAFVELATKFNVTASRIGEYTDTDQLEVFYKEKYVGSFDLSFLHKGLPTMQLKAHWTDTPLRSNWANQVKEGIETENPLQILEKVLALKNIASKEKLIRQYDHEVGGATHIKPFMGENNSPSDSGVVWLYPHGGETYNAVSVACGLNPRISLEDPYLMAIHSVDETIRNLVSAGADPRKVALLDNFCWPDPISSTKNPEGEFRLAQLVRTCAGLKEACLEYKTPLVSGKDSMKNNFRGNNRSGEKLDISILPTLLVTGIGKTDIRHTPRCYFTDEGEYIYILGKSTSGLKLSELAENYDIQNKYTELFPDIDLTYNSRIYKLIHESLKNRIISTIHDISDGGLLTSLAECLFAKKLGARITIPKQYKDNEQLIDFCFNEGAGRFIVSITKDKKEEFESIFSEDFEYLGRTNKDPHLVISHRDKTFLTSTEKLAKSWWEGINV